MQVQQHRHLFPARAAHPALGADAPFAGAAGAVREGGIDKPRLVTGGTGRLVPWVYSTEVTDARIPSVAVPAAIAPKAVYTVTILRDAPNAAGAQRFVAFLLGRRGRQILAEHGLTLRKPSLSGESGSAPADIRALAAGTQ